jgi:hypothetical protein
MPCLLQAGRQAVVGLPIDNTYHPPPPSPAHNNPAPPKPTRPIARMGTGGGCYPDDADAVARISDVGSQRSLVERLSARRRSAHNNATLRSPLGPSEWFSRRCGGRGDWLSASGPVPSMASS